MHEGDQDATYMYQNHTKETIPLKRYRDEVNQPQFDTAVCLNVPEETRFCSMWMNLEPMMEEEYSEINDIHTLSVEDRWRLYAYWHSLYLRKLYEECKQKIIIYVKDKKRLKRMPIATHSKMLK